MAIKFLFVVCAQVLLVKLSASQCISPINDLATQYVSYPSTYGALDLLPPASALVSDYVYTQPYTGSDVIYTNLDTVSSSLNAPGVITVSADNLVIDGLVSVSGSMPLYGTVVVDGKVPTNGQASLVYSAGNGVTFESSGCGQIVTSSGPVVSSSGSVLTSSVPVLGNPATVVASSGLVYGSGQVVTSSGPVVTTSQIRPNVDNNGFTYY